MSEYHRENISTWSDSIKTQADLGQTRKETMNKLENQDPWLDFAFILIEIQLTNVYPLVKIKMHGQ